jgi:hypothetical protein
MTTAVLPPLFRSLRALSLGLAVAAGLAGCSLLLDFDPEGSPCDIDGECLPDYVCDKQKRCVRAGSAPCDPACGPLEKCLAGTCTPVCELDGKLRGCPAGEGCTNGACAPLPSGGLGVACLADDDCNAIPGSCLIPYYGINQAPEASRTGFCTKPCTNDSNCGGGAPKCVSFGGEGANTTQLCAPPAFLPCDSEATCAPSQLTCGVYAVNFPPLKAARACRAPTAAGAKEVGEACSPGIACRNGLCLRDDGGIERRCAAPCDADADCSAQPGASCLTVTLDLESQPTTPRLRTRVCVPDGQSQLLPCSSDRTKCNLDAPNCVSFDGGTTEVCAPACADANAAQQCPSSGATRCRELDSLSYCGPS